MSRKVDIEVAVNAAVARTMVAVRSRASDLHMFSLAQVEAIAGMAAAATVADLAEFLSDGGGLLRATNAADAASDMTKTPSEGVK